MAEKQRIYLFEFKAPSVTRLFLSTEDPRHNPTGNKKLLAVIDTEIVEGKPIFDGNNHRCELKSFS